MKFSQHKMPPNCSYWQGYRGIKARHLECSVRSPLPHPPVSAQPPTNLPGILEARSSFSFGKILAKAIRWFIPLILNGSFHLYLFCNYLLSFKMRESSPGNILNYKHKILYEYRFHISFPKLSFILTFFLPPFLFLLRYTIKWFSCYFAFCW